MPVTPVALPQTGQTIPLASGYQRFSANGRVSNDLGTNNIRPYTLTEQKVTTLKQQSWEQELRELSTSNDVFEQGMTEVVMDYANNGLSIPDSIGITMSAGAANSVHTFPLLDPITGLPIYGANSLLGNEKAQSMRFVQAYYNEVKDGLSVQQYGQRYNYENAFGMYERATKQLGKYWSETKGRMKRECLVEIYNRELADDDTEGAPGVSQGFNPNWFINGDSTVSVTNYANLDALDAATVGDIVTLTDDTGATGATGNAGDYFIVTNATNLSEAASFFAVAGGLVDDNGSPQWNATQASFGISIGLALDAGGASETTTSLTFFDKISFYAKEYLIEPLDDGTYAVTVPMPVWYNLTKVDGEFGTYFTSVTEYSNGTDTYPGEMGRYRDLRIIPDERWVGCDNSTGTPTFEYKLPGNEDNRNKSAYVAGSADYFQLGFLLGKGAYIERKEKDLYFKYDVQDYEQNKGIGTFMECGYNLSLIKYDPTGSNEFPDYAENRSSAVLAFPGVRF